MLGTDSVSSNHEYVLCLMQLKKSVFCLVIKSAECRCSVRVHGLQACVSMGPGEQGWLHPVHAWQDWCHSMREPFTYKCTVLS